MKKPKPKKKPNPVAKSLKDHRPRVVPDKRRYQRKPKHPESETGEGQRSAPL